MSSKGRGDSPAVAQPLSSANPTWLLDALLDKSRSTVDPEAREQILFDIQTLASEQVPLITLYQEDKLMGKAPNVDFEGRADARIPVFDIEMD